MGWFNDDSDQAQAYNVWSTLALPSMDVDDKFFQVIVNAPHKASLAHELIAGAASYEVMHFALLPLPLS